MTHISSSYKYKILLLEGIHANAVKSLAEAGFAVTEVSSALSAEEIVERAQGFDALGIRSKTQLTSDVLSKLPSVLSIGCFCIGTNQVNLEFTNLNGIPVFNAPYSNTRSVAELVIAEMVALARHLGDVNTKAHSGEWKKSAKGNHEIRGKTLGIVGYGHIGSQVSILAEAMGLKVLYFDIVKKLPLGNSVPVDSLEELLEKSDFVTLHVPETPMTKNMMSGKQLKSMKEGAYLINASRGTVVDIKELTRELKSEHIAGAAIDVFPAEPSSNKESFHSELQGLDNVILTPHVGGSTEEAQANIGQEVSESLVRYLTQGFSGGAVNFPHLEVPNKIEGGARIMNVHKNVPGVISQINTIVSERGANIRSQYLSTDNSIGYVVIDLDQDGAEETALNIDELDTSIKTRLV